MNISNIYVLLVFLFLTNISLAQSLCSTYNTCSEEVESSEFTEDATTSEVTATESSTEIGGTSLEMGVTESEVLGTEVSAETIATTTSEVAAGVTSEIVSQTLLSTALQGIPIIGEIIGAALLFKSFLEIVDKLIKKHEKREHDTANALHSGEYNVPIPLSFSIHGHDLNGNAGKLSYVLFIKKRIKDNDVKKYLKINSIDSHIGKNYNLNAFHQDLRYAFSTFTLNNGKYTRYKWNIPVTELKLINNSLWLSTKSSWSHNIDYTQKDNKIIKLAPTASANKRTSIKANDITRYILNTKLNIDDDLCLVNWYVSKLNKEGLNNVKKIDNKYIHYEDINDDHIAVRIKNFDIRDIGKLDDLFITMQVKFRQPFLKDDEGNKNVMPENWDPKEYTPDEFTRYYRSNVPERALNPFENTKIDHTALSDYFAITTGQTKPVEDDNKNNTVKGATPPKNNPLSFDTNRERLYYNTKGLKPEKMTVNMYYFKVNDYQPKLAIKYKNEDEKPLPDNLNIKQLKIKNLFPNIYTSKHTKFVNGDISKPEFGNTHLRIDIPFVNGAKDIENIKIENLNNDEIITVIIREKDADGLSQLIEPKVNYRNDNERKNINYKLISKTNSLISYNIIALSTNTINTWSLQNDNNKLLGKNENNVFKSILLLNIPFHTNDLLQIKTYYTDGSFSMDTNVIHNGGEINRGVYKLISNNKKLSYKSQVFLNSDDNINTNDDWLIEYNQTLSAYTVMNTSNNKVLGFKDDKLSLLDWNPDDSYLLWHIEFIKDYGVLLFNKGNHRYLNDKMSYNFKSGALFKLVFSKKAEPIIEYAPVTIKNIGSNSYLEIDESNKPKLSNTGSIVLLNYKGCLNYTIFSIEEKKYLSFKSKSIKWNNEPYMWLFDKSIKTDNYVITKSDKAIYSNADNELELNIIKTESNDHRKFSIEKMDVQNIDDYTANTNLESYFYSISIHDENDMSNSYYLNLNKDIITLEKSKNNVINNHGSQWLFENVGNGYYTITNRSAKKVLGIKDNQLFFYDWDKDSVKLRWKVLQDKDKKMYLYNPTITNYISAYKTGNTYNLNSNKYKFLPLNLNKVTEFNKIPEDEVIIYTTNNRNKLAISMTSSNRAKLTYGYKNKSSDNIIHKLIYEGCLTYSINNVKELASLYLNENNSDLIWLRAKKSYFTVHEIGGNVTFTTNGKNLKEGYMYLSYDTNSNPDFNKKEYQFKLVKPDNNVSNYLQKYYPFDGNVVDNQSNLSAQTNGELIYAYDATRGDVIYLDGIDDYVDTLYDYNPKFNQGNMTVSLWVKSNEIGDESLPLLSTKNYQFSCGSNDVKKLSAQVNLEPNNNQGQKSINYINSNEDLKTNGNWQFLTFSYATEEDKVVIKIYINGLLEKELEKKNMEITHFNGNLLIGRGSFKSLDKNLNFKHLHFKGMLDDFKLWEVALSDQDVLNEYNKTKKPEKIAGVNYNSKFFKNTNEYWSFNKGSNNGKAGIYKSKYDTQDRNVLALARETSNGIDPIAKADIKIDLTETTNQTEVHFFYSSQGSDIAGENVNVGIYISDDNGKTFTKVFSDFKFKETNSLYTNQVNLFKASQKYNISLLDNPIILRLQHSVEANYQNGLEILNLYLRESNIPITIEENNINRNDNQIKIYPIPINNELKILYNSNVVSYIKLKLINSNGEIIYSKNYNVVAGKNIIVDRELVNKVSIAKRKWYLAKIFDVSEKEVYSTKIYFK